MRRARRLISLADRVELRQLKATKLLHSGRRSELGQFMTPRPVAGFMASLFHCLQGDLRLLDAGAGVGSLLAAFTAEALCRTPTPRSIHATAVELDAMLAAQLRRTARDCYDDSARSDVMLTTDVIQADFIEAAVARLRGARSGRRPLGSFTHALLNPPYKKLSSDGAARIALRSVGIETTNLYTAFLGLSILLLEPGAELIAITPRSFCSGRYFRPFRELLLREMSLQRVHVFESRKAAFADDAVLQETVVIHAVKSKPNTRVVISSSSGPESDSVRLRSVPDRVVVRSGDPEFFIRVVPDASGDEVARALARLPCALDDLNLTVSTGKVVDFRARDYLRQKPEKRTGPLIYPAHFAAGAVEWPKPGKKPNGLLDAPQTAALWMPAGTYVLVKRFSSKEERRRVVAAIFDSVHVPGAKVGFENHLNVFHRHGAGLPRLFARGLSAFLNSTVVDTFFRQFNGHTQVNATDLRSLRYPSREAIEQLGRGVDPGLAQRRLDAIVSDVLGLATRGAGGSGSTGIRTLDQRIKNPLL